MYVTYISAFLVKGISGANYLIPAGKIENSNNKIGFSGINFN